LNAVRELFIRMVLLYSSLVNGECFRGVAHEPE
jgi:hypothetical protein